MKDSPENGHTLELDNYVPALITFLANKLSAGASRLYREKFGVGIVEWRLLALLKVEPCISPNRMCQVIGLDKAAVSRSIKQMQQQQLVTVLEDPTDARKSLVELTDRGQALHDQVFEVAIKREQLLLEELAVEDREALIRILNHLNRRVAVVNAYQPDL
ncbi:MarR family winged helix-turn-helix transcriptional regulator [Oceanobacter kriegii]|uniref:MarR family winged helix-turn-helix transcriptional regulator n=1 Tax=Oceanobacter kriegii TaxID=64972 RepID=UPI00041E9A13|nr:MarR family transcriptional regulator [Oceanobacter kriegii]